MPAAMTGAASAAAPAVAAAVRAGRCGAPRCLPAAGRSGGALATRAPPVGVRHGTEKLMAIGASTAGRRRSGRSSPVCRMTSRPIVITQHMPPGFTRSFAERLNSQCRIRVKEAEHQERLVPGHAYIAPGGLPPAGGPQRRELRGGRRRQRAGEPHKPRSTCCSRRSPVGSGPNAIGVMLTGMGRDGADCDADDARRRRLQPRPG
jgi:two-component system chemotaxis response regulator CheB